MHRDGSDPAALDLVVQLCRALEDERVRYCHWKSNEAIDRSASGDNDLDLLVDRSDADRFGAVLHRLGFKQARPTPSREVPGLIDHYGLDPRSGRLVHLQAHYQLVLGDDMTKNVHLPVEHDYLDSVRADGLIPVPAPEFELAVFVVRMVLKHSTWDAQLCLLGGLSASEQRELDHLLALVPEPGRASAIAGALPLLSPAVLGQCLRALESPPSMRERAAVARALEEELAPYTRHPGTIDLARRTVRRGLRGARHVAKAPARKRLVNGGTLIAVTGPHPDVACAVGDGLAAWLGGPFAVERHPTAGADRTRPSATTFRRARRFASNGGIAICDRLPTDGAAPDLVVELAATDRGRSADDVLAEARGPLWAGL